MIRIDELRKRYPSIPLEIIVKWEVLGRGVRDNQDLAKVGNWVRAGEDYSYQTYEHNRAPLSTVER